MRSFVGFAAFTLLFAGCAERQLLDTSQPAITGQIGRVSRRDIQRVLQMAREELAQTGRSSHAIYKVEVLQPDVISVHHGQPPKYTGDCLDELLYDRVKGRRQPSDRQIICGENTPVG